MAKPGRRPMQAEQREAPLVVDPRWLLRVGALVVGAALVCGYASLCWLFYQGQWQLVLHPVRTTQRPATIGGKAYEFVRFGPDASGLPQRTAWYVSPSADDRYRHLVVLYLPAGDGSLDDALPTLDALRQLGIAVFAMNYRGYGESLATHPTESRMTEDAEAAWEYLLHERAVDGQHVIAFGSGIGASLAQGLAGRHPEIPLEVLDRPRFNIVATVQSDPRVRFLPVKALLHERFALEPRLSQSALPKLIFTEGEIEGTETAKAADPKMTVVMPHFDEAHFDQALRRFLDLYAPPTPVTPLMLKRETLPSK